MCADLTLPLLFWPAHLPPWAPPGPRPRECGLRACTSCAAPVPRPPAWREP